jgi:hypothetical protein
MTFMIHYLVRTAVAPLHFNITSSSPVSRASLDSLYVALARDATLKTGRAIAPDEIVVANIIPMPDAAEPKQIGGS